MADPRVLVVDDDEALLRVVRMTLAYEGFEVQTAADGIEALGLLDATDVDVVVLDLQMPRMDGNEFYRKARERGYRFPVLILSAYGAEKACDDLGAAGFVDKPFDPDALVAKVRAILAYSGQNTGLRMA
jgi:two-component system response regulator MprA